MAKRSPTDIPGIATALIRISVFAVALALVGVYFLSWARLDGMAESLSGGGLTAIVVSPTARYLFTVNSVQTVLLIGCPVVAVLFSLLAVSNYARGESYLFPTLVVLIVSISFRNFTSDLVADNGQAFGSGNLLSIVLSVVLLTHHLTIKLHTRLYVNRKYPSLFRRLYFLTGSGYYKSFSDLRPRSSQKRSQ